MVSFYFYWIGFDSVLLIDSKGLIGESFFYYFLGYYGFFGGYSLIW